MDKKWVVIIIILLLLAISARSPIGFHFFRHEHIVASRQNPESDELRSLKFNFEVNIENTNVKLEDVFVKDTTDIPFLLSDVFKNGRDKMLVCRFSERHCESCVKLSILAIQNHLNTIGKDNVLFLGMHRNNRIFIQEKTHYNIQNMNVYNTAIFDIPVEKLNFPYYFILNSDMTITNVFVPDKATFSITDTYLKMITKQYFLNKK